ncbi:NAD-dependent malic enzyme [Mycolicibacterium sp. 120266]|uniref:NAD-dependent malic enzyme n=1 Tax=Mycolicibacterium sp. 120266 TaxID=3090601 RepID=UPI00299F36FF|nr:NAD-dependent malic enzyme [Mycolicibacterium sp. 120266]MDX1872479.1 NAD-dependent malic enzyme [Mycolicibacterium sp. 120266]
MTSSVFPRIPEALANPVLNRGTAFTRDERLRMGLTGRLPAGVLSLEQQSQRLWHQLGELPTDLARNLLLEQMHNRNETLYYRVIMDHLAELVPVVYAPTVGDAIESYSDEYRGQRGAYLSIDHPDEIDSTFDTFGLGSEDVDLIVCSDAEQILGIGDWGVNGMQIAVGKLAIYSAGAGIDPARTLAVNLDVGTDNERLRDDPFYLGNKHPRVRGAQYDDFIRRYIETAHRRFPKALLHFEDFGPGNARRILDSYGADYPIFNDDVQGTGAVVMAAIYSGLKVTGGAIKDQTMIVFGAGTAGVGIADKLCDAMIADGASPEQARANIWLVDRPGLLFEDSDGLREFQAPYLKNRERLGVPPGTGVDLVHTIAMATPTILLGASTVHGAFDQQVIEQLCAVTPRPMVFPISNPTSRIEGLPADIIRWSGGTALIAAGIPSAPVDFGGVTYHFGQANNFLVFPGLGLGVTVSGATRVTDGMLFAAGKAVAEHVDIDTPGAAMLPDVREIRQVSATVAEAVYVAAHADGVARRAHDNPADAIASAMWQPAYGRV